MGKYMRKPTLTTGITASEYSQSTLGVRTRAIQIPKDSKPDYCYLQLRSRRLEKPSILSDPTRQASRGCTSGSVGLDRAEKLLQAGNTVVEPGVVIGENQLECESMESDTRESTPCSCIMDAETTITPGSSARSLISTASDLRQQDAILTNIPSKHDIDEFFAFHELHQDLLFIERYNFDVKNDIPLSGRYEWVKIHQ